VIFEQVGAVAVLSVDHLQPILQPHGFGVMAGAEFVLVILQILLLPPLLDFAFGVLIVLVIAGTSRDSRGPAPFPFRAFVLAYFFVFRSCCRQVVEVG
jgi:hypothetical protein